MIKILYQPPHINSQGHENVRNVDYGERIISPIQTNAPAIVTRLLVYRKQNGFGRLTSPLNSV